MDLSHLDHLVLTVADVERTARFYEEVLGMQRVVFGEGRVALNFGNQKINLHAAEQPYLPNAGRATPGSADLCFIAKMPLEAVQSRLQSLGIEMVEGPVRRTGACGPILSVYIRDPDGNLIEIANYL